MRELALRSSDPERSRLLDACAPYVHQIVGQGIPKFVQRALVTHGFRLAHGAAREGAPAHGFEPDELAGEPRAFQRAFETRLFFGS